jgi:hypothetical protein
MNNRVLPELVSETYASSDSFHAWLPRILVSRRRLSPSGYREVTAGRLRVRAAAVEASIFFRFDLDRSVASVAALASSASQGVLLTEWPRRALFGVRHRIAR